MTGGKLVGGLIVGFALIFGAVVYYTQVFAYYEEVAADAVTIRLTPLDETSAPEAMLTTNVQAIDGDSSPLRFRACFRTTESLALLTESYVIRDDAVPLNAPGWFDCFDAPSIGAALASGEAIAFLGEAEIADGVDRIVAVYDDGRAFAWHQLNKKYAD
ncbi:DUF6446 family protein [Tropicimonas sp. S265A]|uniref:DUF6446 family protein n=1 Tax=Tropicimonas sp. S265A TaxID=3415134 RepID=UPI003C7AF8B0